MVEQDQDPALTEILKAVSDPTRRSLLTLLVQHGPLRVTDLAARYDMSLNAVSKHIKVLEAAGLALRRTRWREHLIEADLAATARIDAWFSQLRSIWELRLEALDQLVTEDPRMNDLSLTVRRTIKAPPERIFNAWLDPAMMTRFMSPGPNMHVREARSDPRVGGRFFVMMVGERDLPHEGTYREITPHSRLVFTWEAPWSAPDTTVEILLNPVPEGTEVVLTQTRFTDEASRDSHAQGWTGILEKLAAAVA